MKAVIYLLVCIILLGSAYAVNFTTSLAEARSLIIDDFLIETGDSCSNAAIFPFDAPEYAYMRFNVTPLGIASVSQANISLYNDDGIKRSALYIYNSTNHTLSEDDCEDYTNSILQSYIDNLEANFTADAQARAWVNATNITALVKWAIDNNDGVFSIIFNSSSTDGHDVATREATDSKKPYLNLTYTSSAINITNCSIEGDNAINFTLRNESTNALVVSNMDFQFYYYYISGTGNTYRNYSTTTYSNNISHCISPNTSSVITDIMVDYTWGGVHYSYFDQTVNLTNDTKTVTLYITDGTTQVTFNVKDTFDHDIEDALISIQKYDVGTNTYKEVEVVETNNNGDAYANVVLYTEWYRFVVSYQGVQRLSVGPTKLTSTTKNLRIDLVGGDWLDNYDSYLNIVYNLSFNNNTNNFKFTWDDQDSVISTACLLVVQKNITGNTNLSDVCAAVHSGTALYGVENGTGKTYLATAYVYISGNKFVLDVLEQSYATDWQTYDDAYHFGAFLTMLVVLALLFIGIWHPVAAIVMMLVGFGIMRVLGIYYMSWPVYLTLIILGGITIFRLSRT